jgi:single-strand DNA-binding protein
MANFHKLIVIGKLVGNPTVRTFANGGRVAKFGLPVNFTQRKLNPQTGQWEGDSFIIDVDAFNRPEGKFALADFVEKYLHKGSQVYVEGRLKPNEYTDKNGVKVFKPVLVVDQLQLLDPKSAEAGGMDDDMRASQGDSFGNRHAGAASGPAGQPPEPSYDEAEPAMGGAGKNPADDIPF